MIFHCSKLLARILYSSFTSTLTKVIKEGLLQFAISCWTKMSDKSINRAKNIDELEQISLIITFTTKLHIYHRVTQHIFTFQQSWFSRIPPHPYYLCESALIENDRRGHRKRRQEISNLIGGDQSLLDILNLTDIFYSYRIHLYIDISFVEL